MPKALLVGTALTLLAAYPAPTVAGPFVRADLRVTHLANEGFLVETDGRKILIDALFDRGLPGYARLPEALRSELMAARGRFAGVDLVLATHHHADHFDAETVAAHLRSNRRALFVSTEQAVAALARIDPKLAASKRVRGLFPAPGERVAIEHPDLALEVLHLHHGHDRRPPVQNLGFLLRAGNWKILHVGDTESTAEDFALNDLVAERIDIAFLPGWYLGYRGSRELVDAVIRPRRIVAMHLALPSAPASWFGEAQSFERIVEAIRRAFPEAATYGVVSELERGGRVD